MWKIKLKKTVENLLRKFQILYMFEWNSYLEICRRPQAMENSRQYLLTSPGNSGNSRLMPLNRDWSQFCQNKTKHEDGYARRHD